jgi:hypothetical protein
MADEEVVNQISIVQRIQAELDAAEPTQRQRILEAIALAALGSIPWVGGVLAAAANLKGDLAADKQDSLRNQWLHEHQGKLQELQATLEGMFERLNKLGGDIEERLQSKEYLGLVRKTFREWDQADTQEKRKLLVDLITNAAGTRLCSDDILRLFLDWIESYHEAHFAVIRVIHNNPGVTKLDIWNSVYGQSIPRDDSPEADLYKLLIGDLTLGRVIRQARETDASGRFLKKQPIKSAYKTSTMKSPFDDTEQYVLTEMGKQFVHYTMNELVTRLSDDSAEAST